MIYRFTALARNTLRYRYSQAIPHQFVERPYTPQLWNSLAIAELSKVPKKEYLEKLLHSILLMDQNINPFNYDFYQWSCWRLVENQQKLSKDEILMMLRLSCRYKVKIEPFHYHIENELFLRIHRDYEYEIQQYDAKIQQDMASLLLQLQEKSKDYFKLLNQQENDLSEDEELTDPKDEETDKIQAVEKSAVAVSSSHQQILSQEQKIIENLSDEYSKKSKKKKQISLSDLVEIIELLRMSGSKNIPLLQYILELLTIKYQSNSNISSQEMLEYVRGLTYVCQSLMEEYASNKEKYTRRSIKRIYKFQTLYYQEHLRQLEAVKSTLSEQQIEDLVGVYAAFPIKRRETRRRIGASLCEQMKLRNLDKNIDLLKKLMNINKNDENMKKQYCKFIGIELQQAKLLGYYIEKQKKQEKEEKKKEEDDLQEKKKEQDSKGSTEQLQKI